MLLCVHMFVHLYVYVCIFVILCVCVCVCMCVCVCVPHPLIVLRCAEDPGLSDKDVTEGPAAAALLVEAGHGAHCQGLDHQGLGVRQTGPLRHHATHVAYVPAPRGGPGRDG